MVFRFLSGFKHPFSVKNSANWRQLLLIGANVYENNLNPAPSEWQAIRVVRIQPKRNSEQLVYENKVLKTLCFRLLFLFCIVANFVERTSS